jgi:hypothetical protein
MRSTGAKFSSFTSNQGPVIVACKLEVQRTSSRGTRLLIAGLAVAALVAVVAGFIVGYALRFPPPESASPSNQGVTLDLETVAAVSDAIEYPTIRTPTG